MSHQLINRRTALIPANGPMMFESPDSVEPAGVLLVMIAPNLVSPNTAEIACRKLLPDPGEWRIVCWGDFKDLLSGQLAHPERLRDSHRLACYVQVYEVLQPQRIELLAREVFGDAECDRQLCPLNLAAATRLQLIPLLQRRPHIPHQMRHERGLLLPQDRLFTLQLISDPTVDQVQATPVSKSSVRRNAIPERFLKPWEFRLSREEALYDLKHDGGFNHLFRRAKNWLMRRKQFQKWQELLSGKNLEDQLWSVRPPNGAITDAFIKDWARKTLEQAGYDSATMLVEWQVYWKRKGLTA
jgi:hypothetical protein